MDGHQIQLMRTFICFAFLIGCCICSDCPLEQEELGSMCSNNDFAYCASVTSFTRSVCIDSQCVFWTPENCTCTSDSECQSVLPDTSMCYNGQCLRIDLLLGEPCITDSQCLSNSCSEQTQTCEGVGYGQVCLLVGCQEGLACYLNGTYPTCNYPKTNGQNCTSVFDDNECENGLVCALRNNSGTIERVCQPYKTLGQECALPQDCEAGLTCVTVNRTFTCQNPVPLGQYCNTNYDCGAQAICNFGNCTLMSSLLDGEKCNQDLACQSNLCLYTYENGDDKAFCASNVTGSIRTGEYCNPLIPQLCETGYCSCTGWTDTGACINAICECPLNEGDSCVGPGSRCASGLICGYEGKCVKLFSKGNGANCINNLECELCRYCSDIGECSSHTGDSCFDSLEFYQMPVTSVDFIMHAQVEKADSNDYCVNGKTCQCDGETKQCESAGEDWEMTAQNWFMCSQFGSHFGTDAMTYTCGFIPDIYYHNPPTSELTQDCQRLIADYFCCTWYTTLFVEKYQDNQVVLNNRASLNGYLDYAVDCYNRTLTDAVFQPCCGSNNISNDCPYWSDPVFSNWEYTFSLVNSTECKSYAITHFSECSDDNLPWAWIIAGIVSASVMLAAVLGVGVWFVRRKRGKNTYTTIPIVN